MQEIDMTAPRIFGAAVLTASLLALSAFGACRVDDADFASADGGCKDIETGLVWSPDLRGVTPIGGDGLVNPTSNLQSYCNGYLNSVSYGGFSDWRVPTLGEVEVALANGLNSHLDYFLDGSGDDGDYYWTACEKRVKGIINNYNIRHSDGAIRLSYQSGAGNWLICVRGLPADPKNDCPSEGKKNSPASAASALSQTATGGLLLLPLGIVVAARCVRPRRP
jgi:hypothetical protein